MAKYVEFNIPDKESSYIKVNDFNLETIRNLPLYNSKWVNIKFLEGEPRYYDGKLLGIFPAKTIKSIYYGKRISYENVKNIIGKDLKYDKLLWEMDTTGRQAFFESEIFAKLPNKNDYNNEIESFIQSYDKTHYCLYVFPDKFSVHAFYYENAITIEEFDPDVKLDYSKQLENIQMNAKIGEEYILKYKYILEMFKTYFESLLSLKNFFTKENYNQLFDFVKFDFRYVKDLNSVDDILFFLQVFEYTENKSYYSDLLEDYKNYIRLKYEDNMKLD